MSAEEIFRNYPPDLSTTQFISAEAERRNVDPVIYLGLEMVRAGRTALVKKNDDIGEGLDQYTREEVEEFMVEQTEDEHSAILLGHLVVELHDSMETGRFDLGGLIGKFNMNISGTLLPKLRLPKGYEDSERIDYDDLLGMKTVYSGDKTFTTFFKKPEYLPKQLERFLREEMGVFDSKSFELILENWEKRASLLVPQSISKSVVPQEKKGNSTHPEIEEFSLEQRATFIDLKKRYEDGQLD